MSKSPGGHMPGAASRLDAELTSNRSSAPIGLSPAVLDRRVGQIKRRLLLCSSADSATATRRRGRIDRHRYRGTHRPGGIRRPG
jgi:hypothetical protein